LNFGLRQLQGQWVDANSVWQEALKTPQSQKDEIFVELSSRIGAAYQDCFIEVARRRTLTKLHIRQVGQGIE